MRLSAHPLWLVGFRPFFSLACLSGLSLPLLWTSIYLGALPARLTAFTPVQWHAHEMFFGFGWAVLGGFLLTASKNWVGVRGWHGAPLMLLVAAWLFERAGMWFGGEWPVPLFQVSNNLFLISVVAMILWTLILNRKTDSYRDNLFFVVALPLFLAAKNLMLSSAFFEVGWSMAVGLFRIAFLLMLERTLTQFMQGAFQVLLLRDKRLDAAIKVFGLAMVFERLMPPPLAGWIGLVLAALLAFRFVFWKPQLAVRRLDIGILYLGYLAIVAHLLLGFADQVAHPSWVGAFSVHLFAFGVMGLVVPSMLIRISRGHTGRKVAFDGIDRLVLWIMLLAFGARVVAPQIHPGGYAAWLCLAASCWFICFATLAWRYIPFLIRPRVDGKEH